MATACSGTDIAVVALRGLCRVLGQVFGDANITVHHLYSCEKDAAAIKWIRSCLAPPPGHLFLDLSDLAGEVAFDSLTNSMCVAMCPA